MKATIRLAVLAATLGLAPAMAQDPRPQGDAPPPPPASAAPPGTQQQAGGEHQAMMEAWEKAGKPGAQHRQLAEHFVGTWNTKQTMWMDPSAPPTIETGQSVDTAVLGGRQVHTSFKGQVMGQPFEGMGTTGYDNVTGKYTSTWTDSMSTGTMLMHGSYDPGTKSYTFRGEMPDPSGTDAATPVRQVLRIVDADHHVFEMHETRGGQERKVMQIDYSRASP